MNKIMDIVRSMGDVDIIDKSPRAVNTKVRIGCSVCGSISNVTAGAIYRQNRRGHKSYICKSCAGKTFWTTNNRKAVSKNSKEKWENPGYAGTIVGKALAEEIKRISDTELEDLLDAREYEQ